MRVDDHEMMMTMTMIEGVRPMTMTIDESEEGVDGGMVVFRH